MELRTRKLFEITFHRQNVFYSAQFYFSSLFAPLRINKRKNTLTVGIMPWNNKKILRNFENLGIWRNIAISRKEVGNLEIAWWLS